jgi:flagellar FliJ protein
MKIFRFSLAKVLDLRERTEREKAKSVADARQESDSARQAKESLEEIQRKGRARLAEAHQAGGAIGLLRNMEFVLEKMEGHLKEADEVCQKADESLVESVKEYQQAFKERDTLDRLKTRRMEEWKVEEGRRQQKDLDEIAVTRHGVRSQGSHAPEEDL